MQYRTRLPRELNASDVCELVRGGSISESAGVCLKDLLCKGYKFRLFRVKRVEFPYIFEIVESKVIITFDYRSLSEEQRFSAERRKIRHLTCNTGNVEDIINKINENVAS